MHSVSCIANNAFDTIVASSDGKDGAVVFGGSFSTPCPYVAFYDAHSDTITCDSNSPIDDAVYVVKQGANGYMIGGAFTNKIYSFTNGVWSSPGDGCNSDVLDIDFFGADLYVTGRMTVCGGIFVNYVAKWDGVAWSALGGGINVEGWALRVHPSLGVLVGVPDAYLLRRFDGVSWGSPTELYTASDYAGATSIAINDNWVYISGILTIDIGSSSANGIVAWNGSNVKSIGASYGDVFPIDVDSQGVLYAAGSYQVAVLNSSWTVLTNNDYSGFIRDLTPLENVGYTIAVVTGGFTRLYDALTDSIVPCGYAATISRLYIEPSTTPTPSATASATATPSHTASATASLSATASVTATPSHTASATVTPSVTATTPVISTATVTISQTTLPTTSGSPTPTSSPTTSSSPTSSESPITSSSPTPTSSPTTSESPITSSSPTTSASPTTSSSPTPSSFPTTSASATPSSSLTTSASPTLSSFPTTSASATPSSSLTTSASPTPSSLPTTSASPTSSSHPTYSATQTYSSSVSSSKTAASTQTPVSSVSSSKTAASTQTPVSSVSSSKTAASTQTPVSSVSSSKTAASTQTPVSTISPTRSHTPTFSKTNTVSNSPSQSALSTISPTGSASSTVSITPTAYESVTRTATQTSSASITPSSPATFATTPSLQPTQNETFLTVNEHTPLITLQIGEFVGSLAGVCVVGLLCSYTCYLCKNASPCKIWKMKPKPSLVQIEYVKKYSDISYLPKFTPVKPYSPNTLVAPRPKSAFVEEITSLPNSIETIDYQHVTNVITVQDEIHARERNAYIPTVYKPRNDTELALVAYNTMKQKMRHSNGY